jgi:hypothetical protein
MPLKLATARVEEPVDRSRADTISERMVKGGRRAPSRIAGRHRLLIGLAIVAASLFAGAVPARAHAVTVLSLTGNRLHWNATARSHEYIESRTTSKATTYVRIDATGDTPPAVAGVTVAYRVRPRFAPHSWSNSVSLAYPDATRLTRERSEERRIEREIAKREAKERAEREAKEIAEREAKELAEREAKEKAEREAKELAERQAKEKAEREAKELAERQAKETAEREAKELAERQAKEKAEREARERAEREAKEKLEREERERREREEHGGAVVNATPTGPLPPAGGWHVAFADGFGAALGSSAGQDNFWYPNEGSCCHPYVTAHGNNTNELEGYNASQVHVGPSGLELVDEYHPNAMPAEGSWPVRNYLSGAVQTFAKFTTIHPFAWEPGRGETWAFECVCKLPPYFNGLDAGWWSTDSPWTDELDFFETWNWGVTQKEPLSGEMGFAWVYETQPLHVAETALKLWRLFDPATAFHRYTTVVTPNNTVEGYIDGIKEYIYKPPYLHTQPKMGLILSNALRSVGGANPDPAFTSGVRTWDIRAISVYEDGAHAGQNIEGGGVAPGTVVK